MVRCVSRLALLALAGFSQPHLAQLLAGSCPVCEDVRDEAAFLHTEAAPRFRVHELRQRRGPRPVVEQLWVRRGRAPSLARTSALASRSMAAAIRSDLSIAGVQYAKQSVTR